MPSAKLTLDFDTRKFTDANGAVVLTLSGKKNSIREYELTIVQNELAMSLPAASTMTVALKKTTDVAGTLLWEDTATRHGWGTGSRWHFFLDLTGEEFTTAILGTNVDFDIMIILPDGQQFMSVTVPFKIEKPVQVPP